MGALFWIGAALGAVLLLGVVPLFIMGHVLYAALLTRNKPGKWDRVCPAPGDAEYKGMFDEGDAWDEKWREKKTEVSVESDGLRLAGEYYDFGTDRAVIIIPGRTETVLYSRFFAEPYRKAGCGVLVIDPRAHGLSEGKRSCLGYREYRDIHAWARMLAERFGVRTVVLHGICIGASTALFAAASPERPECIRALAAEGIYTDFYETLKNHMKDQGHAVYPIAPAFAANALVFSGANIVTDGPKKRIRALSLPILFLHSKEDIFSLPEKSRAVMDACPSKKTVVWFERGYHSRIRAVEPEAYDRAITDFLASLGE